MGAIFVPGCNEYMNELSYLPIDGTGHMTLSSVSRSVASLASHPLNELSTYLLNLLMVMGAGHFPLCPGLYLLYHHIL